MVHSFLALFLLLTLTMQLSPSANSRLMTEDPDRILEISLDSKGCRGDCPVYTVKFSCSGDTGPGCAASYEGRRGAAHLGRYKGKMAVAAFSKLAKEVEALEFFKLAGQHQRDKFDALIVSLGVRTGRRRKTVTTYDLGAGPPALVKMRKAVDDAAAEVDWEVVVRP